MQAPTIVSPVPAQIVNEGAAYGPFDLKKYIKVAEGSPTAKFQAELNDGRALPTGLICTSDGIITGIPAKNTQGVYELLVTAYNEAGTIRTTFLFTIKPSLLITGNEYSDKLKKQIWEALGQDLPIPDLAELYNRPITPFDVYYLLERWGVLKIWDAFNLDAPSDKMLLNLPGASPHYHVYDRGSCLVMVPKDLFSHERTVEDGLKTARALAKEAYDRDWTIELVGFEKFTRSAWIELQRLGDKYGKYIEVVNFTPTPSDQKLYEEVKKFRPE